MSSKTYDKYLEAEYAKYLENGGDDVPELNEEEYEEMIKIWENTKRRRKDDE
jgi:hypothetical protein